MAEETTITLTRPLKDDKGNEINTLTLREPNLGDLMKADKFTGNVGKVAAIIASQTGIPIPVLEAMGGRDFRVCDKVIDGFLGND
jgi:hypothetical protein